MRHLMHDHRRLDIGADHLAVPHEGAAGRLVQRVDAVGMGQPHRLGPVGRRVDAAARLVLRPNGPGRGDPAEGGPRLGMAFQMGVEGRDGLRHVVDGDGGQDHGAYVPKGASRRKGNVAGQ